MATVTKGRTFVSGETVTPTKLNDLVDLATVTAIQTADISDGQITNAKVSDSAAIALSKLATGALPTAITTTTGNIVDASVTPAKLSQPYTLATAQASTSGTSIDFTGIPSWAKRITVMFSGVSTNGTSTPQIQVGSGSFVTSGYLGSASGMTNVVASVQHSSGFLTTNNHAAADVFHGTMTLVNIASNTWIVSGTTSQSNSACSRIVSGSVSLAGALDRVRITTVNGTDTFDAGTINIAYE